MRKIFKKKEERQKDDWKIKVKRVNFTQKGQKSRKKEVGIAPNIGISWEGIFLVLDRGGVNITIFGMLYKPPTFDLVKVALCTL